MTAHDLRAAAAPAALLARLHGCMVHACTGKFSLLLCPVLQRYLRAVLVILPLSAVMLFPIGALTGALSNLNEALCGGTPGGLGLGLGMCAAGWGVWCSPEAALMGH